MSNMRYTVGEKVPFVFINFEMSTPRFVNLYLPWEDTLKSIEIYQLTCSEHHKVPGDWDDEIKYDGFHFTDEVDGKTRIWYNQYPRARYGQISTEADHYVHPSKKDMDPHPGRFAKYEDARIVIERILDGIKSPKLNDVQRQALEKHRDELVSLVEKTCNCKVNIGHLVMNGDEFLYIPKIEIIYN